MYLKMLEDDTRFNLKSGEIYEAKRYWLDPTSKFSLLKRVPDGFNPECNVYSSQVEIVPNPTPKGE